jgi:transcriptional regulator with XRE-family HTH domain
LTSIEKIRRRNFRIFRAILFDDASQRQIGRALNLTQGEVSQIETGKKGISQYFARRLEKEFSLPVGWMDRNNADLRLVESEFQLVSALRELPVEVGRKILDLVNVLSAK